MAQGANTFDRYDLGSGATDNVREQLSDVISNISPTSLPFTANVGTDTSDSDYEEWETDELDDAADNAHIDGDTFTADPASPAVRIGNFHQIGRKELQVSRRANRVQKAGRDNEMSYQMAKKGKALRRDVETGALIRKPARKGAAAGANAAPHTAGVPAWLRTNIDMGASGAAPTTSGGATGAGYPNAGGTVGTARAMSEAVLLDIIGKCYAEGSVPNMVLFGRKIKVAVSAFFFGTSSRIADQEQEQGRKRGAGVTVIGAVDSFQSDFGTHDFVPDLFAPESAAAAEVPVLNTELWKLMYLDKYKFIPQPNDGDAERELLVVDWGTKCMNEKGSGIIAAVNSNTAMVA